ncbi:MAG: phosphoribosylglycinamide formyltransferase [Acidobacteriota bacterium]|nr:phosphoribosylglycinamide formyltransferase [Acidobacteriota bacterium]
MSTRVGVLLSGRGSNFLALHDAIERGEVPAEIALVVSNVESAPGLVAARERGLKTVCLPHGGEPSREAHDAKVIAALRAAEAEWICLAGYMRLLSADFVRAFPRRILNIHPSLLPSFPGLHVQEAALDWGARVSGCTVHLVDEELDHGPIVVQRAVPILDDDDADTLAGRILVEEHEAYAEAIRRLVTEPWAIDGRRIVFGSAA